MYTADNMPYGLRCIPEKGVVWITATHMGFINVYSTSYEVTDPKVRAELIELFKRARREEYDEHLFQKAIQVIKNEGAIVEDIEIPFRKYLDSL